MKRICVILLAIWLMLSGCDGGYGRHSAGATDFYDAMTVIEESVPYLGYMDLRLDIIKLLDTDDYGRRLYQYSLLAYRQQEILLVTQKTEENRVYYYEDRCYLIKDRGNDFLASEIESLKENNDWNQPINDSKSRGISFVRDKVPAGLPNGIRKIYLEYIQAGYHGEEELSSDSISVNGLENYPEYGHIMLVRVRKENTSKLYLSLYDCGSENPIIVFEEVENPDAIGAEIITFKEKYCAARRTGGAF